MSEPVTKATEQDTFGDLFLANADFLYRFAYRLSGRPDLAEDLVQQLAVQLLHRGEDLTGKDSLRAWLGRCMYNLFISDYRKTVSLRLVDEEDGGLDNIESTEETQELTAHRQSVSRILEQAMQTLSDEHQQVLQLHDAEGITLPELAEITDIPLGTLKSRLHRARVALREQLGPDAIRLLL